MKGLGFPQAIGKPIEGAVPGGTVRGYLKAIGDGFAQRSAGMLAAALNEKGIFREAAFALVGFKLEKGKKEKEKAPLEQGE